MEILVTGQGKNDPPRLDLPQPIIDMTGIERMMFCVMEGGMASGEPSVIIAVSDKEGSVAFQTSLDKFLAAATGMVAYAETHWGWTRPEGYYSLVPPSPEAKKILLEAIKKELEE